MVLFGFLCWNVQSVNELCEEKGDGSGEECCSEYQALTVNVRVTRVWGLTGEVFWQTAEGRGVCQRFPLSMRTFLTKYFPDDRGNSAICSEYPEAGGGSEENIGSIVAQHCS